MSDNEDMFSRWSRRKRAAVEEAAARHEPAPEPEPVDEPPLEDEPEEALLARLGLPRPESLKQGDDFSGFMQSGVPQFLRTRALRRLWRTNPVLANLDGLNDYDEDFRSPEETMKVLKTAYKVGRGFLKDAEEARDEVEVAALSPDETGDVDDGRQANASDPEAESDAAPEDAETEKRDAGAAPTSRHADDPAPRFRPKRMRFDDA